MNVAKYQITIKIILPNSGTYILLLTGRDAWAAVELIRSGERGCTPIDNPAPRWSAYVHNLRKMGMSIETITEPHGGDFSGNHARYVLRDTVTVVSVLDNRGRAMANIKRGGSDGQKGA